jgi:hypothetical protein
MDLVVRCACAPNQASDSVVARRQGCRRVGRLIVEFHGQVNEIWRERLRRATVAFFEVNGEF